MLHSNYKGDIINTLQVSEYLNLLQGLNRQQVIDLLFNLGLKHKDFVKLLAITHNKSIRNVMLANKDLAKLGDPNLGTFLFRVSRYLSKQATIFTSHEYHILFTLVENPTLTPKIRESLRESLNFLPVGIQVERELYDCAVCSIPTAKEVCKSCMTNIKQFTGSRRESFSVPINHLNFHIRGYVNTTGVFQKYYNDWLIEKILGQSEVSFKLLDNLPDGRHPIQYGLPFVEDQKIISLL